MELSSWWAAAYILDDFQSVESFQNLLHIFQPDLNHIMYFWLGTDLFQRIQCIQYILITDKDGHRETKISFSIKRVPRPLHHHLMENFAPLPLKGE